MGILIAIHTVIDIHVKNFGGNAWILWDKVDKSREATANHNSSKGIFYPLPNRNLTQEWAEQARKVAKELDNIQKGREKPTAEDASQVS